MRSLAIATLAGLAIAQSNFTISSTLLTSSVSHVIATSSLSATTSSANSAITVALDGSGQYTAINAAVSAAQNSGIATVTVLPGKPLTVN
jgi:biopolymer transport protein ExbD